MSIKRSPMTNKKVFVIGSIKTGTTTAGHALERLGFNHYHGGFKTANTMMPMLLSGEYEKIFDIINQYDGFDDIPFSHGDFYKVLFKNYPESKFILTVRDPNSWLQSMIKQFTWYDSPLDAPLHKSYELGWFGAYEHFKLTYGDVIMSTNKQYVMDTYEKRNEEIIAFFEDKGNKLLVLDIPKNSIEDNWKLLCNFLEKPMPNIPFPYVNRRKK